MKKHLIMMTAILAVAASAFAQRIDVSLTLAYGVFVVGEPVLVQVKVSNQMRESLEFGDEDTFLMEISKGDRYNELSPETDKPFIKPRRLASGGTFEHKMEMDKWFPLDDTGKYLIRAVVVHNDMRYESVVKSFDVIPGISMKEGVQMFAGKQHFQRNFKLVHWARNQFDHLFLRIEDAPSGKIWDTIDLGTIVRGGDPRLDIAPTGEVTVLHRANADSFLRTVIWSLPDSVEIAERNALLDPASASISQMRSVYGDQQGKKAEEKKSSWWKFWK